MGILTYGFYFLAIFPIALEIFRLFGVSCHGILKGLEDKKNEEEEANKELLGLDPSASPKNEDKYTWVVFAFISFFLVMMPYFLWALIGLFSSQYIFFIALLVLSLIQGFIVTILKDRTSLINVVSRVDAFITLVLLIAMLINKFHFRFI